MARPGTPFPDEERLLEADERLKSLPFDLYQRYRVLRRAGPLFATPDSRLRVLDVGGSTPVLWDGFRSLAREMLPESQAIVVDTAQAGGLDSYLRASAAKLPFPDGSFDLVCSFDVLEHLRPEERLPAIREMLRVTRDGLLLAFPFDSPVNRAAEKIVTDYVALYFRTSIPPLAEHARFGLPDRSEVEEFLSGEGHPAASFNHGNSDVWQLMMLTQQSLRLSGCDNLVESLNLRFNLEPCENDWAEPAYRAYFLISKRNTTAALDAFRAMPARSESAATADSVLPVCRLLLEIAHRGRVLGERDRQIRSLEAALAESRQRSHSLRTKFQDELRALEAAIADPKSNEGAAAEFERLREFFGSALSLLERDRTFAEDIAERLDALSRRVDENARQVSGILQSRIWRTLCAAGEVMLRLRGWRPALKRQLSLTCVEPAAGDSRPRSGTVAVQGWVWAPSGVAAVDVQVDSRSPGQAQIGLPSPDAARALPGTQSAGNAGYRFELDTSRLAPGMHSVRIRASGRSGAVRVIERSILVTGGEAYASDYEGWVAEYECPNDALNRLRLEEFTRRPLVSVIMPVCDPDPDVLDSAIRSVRAQVYENWELCIADDGSKSSRVAAVLDRHCREDSRIKLTRLGARGGISAASNAALAIAAGEFAAMLDHDDELSPDALFRVVEVVNWRPEADVIYSDEDKIDTGGRRYEPFFKPDWSPDLLLSENYICHLLVARLELIRAVGGFRSEYDGSQDYDLILRVTRDAREIIHIPAVLYHWRAVPNSTARDPNAKPESEDAARRAIAEHLKCSGIPATVEPGAVSGRWRVRYAVPPNSTVSILIPSAGKMDVLRSNIVALTAKTDYPDYEIVVIDNSPGNAVLRYVESARSSGQRIRCIDVRDWPFNYSAINNEAARHCDSPLLLFLNDDTEVIAPDWLTSMVELAARPEVGAVGARLLYPDDSIQHAGVVLGLYGYCGHAFRKLDGNARRYFDFPDVIRNVSAVTGACMLARADVFREMGGFDETQFPIAYNDIDLCLRMGQKGYRILYTPHALLYHRESYSKTERELIPHPAELLALQNRWKDLITADPFYSPHLTRSEEDYSLRRRH